MIGVALAAASQIAKSKLREVKVNTGYTVAAAATGVVAATFALIAATSALADAVGFIGACLIMAGLFAVASLLILLLRSSALTKAKSKAQKAEAVLPAALMSGSKNPPASPVAMSLIAIAAGFLLSQKK